METAVETITEKAIRSVYKPSEPEVLIHIPNEYVGQEIEVIMFLRKKEEPKYNAETLEAMQETLDILDGKLKVKSYSTVEEMNADIDAEDDD